MEQQHYQQLRWILSLAALTLLLVGLYRIFQPFLVSVCWAAILVLTSWPLATKLQRRLPTRPYLVAGIMTSLLLFILVGLVAPIVSALTSELEDLSRSVRVWIADVEAQPPEIFRDLPLFGNAIFDKIQDLHQHRDEIPKLLADYQAHLLQFATLAARGIFGALANITLCLITAFFFFAHGANLAHQLQRALARIGGKRFTELLDATRATVSAAVYGILATALAQGTLAGIGFVVAGAPVPLLLGLATMIMSLIPFGPPVVYLPVAGLIVLNGAPWYVGVLLAAWGIIVVSTIDNLLRPLFISQATQMPVLLVFFGVIGGMISFGLLGLFIGPVLIAIAQVLWREWISELHGHHHSSAIG